MQICIRRGAKQIGGTAVEFIASTGERMIVDIGNRWTAIVPAQNYYRTSWV